ncbi:potassium transporter 5 [Momordica charantia]|uniref:Potassium transporter n=1 Tax=Momordica charantia TaxID=3673 RepID=A0A6J1DX61_MOMCH|nr:potassium transporter 5 [Momordica charantia]
MAEEKVSEANANNGAQEKNLRGRKSSWATLRRVDSLNLEAGRFPAAAAHQLSGLSWQRTLSLAFQSVGVVYGDIGTSPLYVYASTFTNGIKNTDDVIGVLSLIIYTIALVPLLKYVFIVLWANDNGDGGTFALYSLLCRYAKVGLIPNQQPEDRELSNYQLVAPSNLRRSQKVKEKLENSAAVKIALFLVTIAGTSMVIGDGVLTPCISVLSAVSGINSLGTDAVVGISVAILIILFSIQRFGTDKVGFSFAPIILVWFSFIGGIGLYNLFKHDPAVLKAFNPKYIFDYFRRNGKQAWISLGGVFLCITGTEAMFADLGHFNVRAIQISFSSIVFPALIAAYTGQAAYLRKFPGHVLNTFYDSIPDPLYWPTFVVAVAASIIASQAMISGAFAIISQSLSLGCFPRVKVVHTSHKYEGQVYIPEINYLLMLACVIVTVAFRTTENIGHAYGIAVVSVMIMTTAMVSLIMVVIWKTSIWLIAAFFLVFGAIELLYFSSVLYKFTQGGFLPLVLAFFLMAVMVVWHYVHRERYMFELRNKVSNSFITELANNHEVNRIPGIGLLYSELVQGIPPIFPHFITSIPSVHSVIVFVSIKSIPISKVTPGERFLFRQVEPREYHMFRCVVRYGYKDVIIGSAEFERQLVDSLKEFIRQEHIMLEGIPNLFVEQPTLSNQQNTTRSGKLEAKTKVKASSSSSATVHVEGTLPEGGSQSRGSSGSIQSFNASKSRSSSNAIVQVVAPLAEGVEEEMEFVERAMKKGVVYLLGEAEVVADPKSSLLKKMVVNYAYSFLRKNFRQGENVLEIPHTRLLRVGMTYEI